MSGGDTGGGKGPADAEEPGGAGRPQGAGGPGGGGLAVESGAGRRGKGARGDGARGDGAAAAARAFDALYVGCAPELTRQVRLLTGDGAQAARSVQYAFHTAWEHWPEVARDRDPQGWVRAAAYEHALSPWRRLRLRPGRGSGAGADTGAAAGEERALLTGLLALPPAYRRAVMLYDGLGLDLPETAAEVEASTPATAGRVTHGRAALARSLPELAGLDPERQGELLNVRLRRLREAQPADVPEPGEVRRLSERRTAGWGWRTAALVAALVVGVVLTVLLTPDYTRTGSVEQPPWEEPATTRIVLTGEADPGP
ncbi:RNA polymerase sigma factor [Streptomyces polyrhachis]|uniref:RNA polymerase sigma factor n=1 Tax=Streptomyces polyrhachis TaxID=1282885 RepID=A0ABW2GCX4_9ACTN